MKILVTGKKGFIASNIISHFSNSNFEVIGVGREDFDLANKNSTDQWFKGKEFDLVIHTANVGGSRLIHDNEKVLNQNLSMFYNLTANKNKFSKLISFGSGAELGYPSTPYGISKHIINKIIDTEPNFYNIRVYGVFGVNELNTRFIKNNIIKYLNKEPLIIHQNKYMDFIFIDDLIKVVEHVIQNPAESTSEAIYIEPYSLLDIASMINDLSNHKSEIIVEQEELGVPYVGYLYSFQYQLDYTGLKKGIEKVYKKLLNEY